MSIHLPAGDAFTPKSFPESAPPEQNPKILKTKVPNQEAEKLPEHPALAGGAGVLSEPRTELVKRLQPLQPVIQKAIVDNRALGKVLRDVGSLTERGESGNGGAEPKQKAQIQEVHPLPPAAPPPEDQLIHHDSRV